jgi:hypothetical protein
VFTATDANGPGASNFVADFAAVFGAALRADVLALRDAGARRARAELRQWTHRQAGAFAVLGYAPLTDQLSTFNELLKHADDDALGTGIERFIAYLDDLLPRLDAAAAAHRRPS